MSFSAVSDRRTMKAILKPTLFKIILAAGLFILSGYLWRMYVISTISDTFPWGFPLQYYMAWGPCPPGEICSETNVFFFVFDILFWYILSGFMISRIESAKA
jgi:hypothetical protein